MGVKGDAQGLITLKRNHLGRLRFNAIARSFQQREQELSKHSDVFPSIASMQEEEQKCEWLRDRVEYQPGLHEFSTLLRQTLPQIGFCNIVRTPQHILAARSFKSN